MGKESRAEAGERWACVLGGVQRREKRENRTSWGGMEKKYHGGGEKKKQLEIRCPIFSP